jgi:hypothetical protein
MSPSRRAAPSAGDASARDDEALLARLIGDRHEFATAVWGRTARHQRGRPGALSDLVSISDFDRLFTTRALRPDDVAVWFKNAIADPGLFLDRGGRSPRAFLDLPRLFELFTNGATIIVNDIDAHIAALGEVCDALSRAAQVTVKANAYVTGAAADGYRIHSDDHDVLVLQVAGAKRWSVWRPGEARLKPGDHLMEVTLEAGDTLFIPRGFPHCTQTVDQPSVHVSVGFIGPSWRQVFSYVLEHMPAASLDGSLPFGFANDEAAFRRIVAEHFETWIDAIRQLSAKQLARELIAKFSSRVSPPGRGAFATAFAEETLNADAQYRLVSTAPLEIARAGHLLLLKSGEVTSVLPIAAEGVVKRLRARRPVSASLLVPHVPVEKARSLFRQLVRAGALAPHVPRDLRRVARRPAGAGTRPGSRR